MNAIEVTNLTKSYNNFTLYNVNFNVPMGSIVGLVGENGAGKSTTLKLIMNAVNPDSGSIKVLEKDNKSNEFNDVKQDIGIVLDEAYFPEVLNAKNINSVMKNTYNNWSEEIFFNYITKFNLDLTKKFKDYSRGMKMKLAIAVSLSHGAKLLILDEATSGLDPMIRQEILDVFNEFTRDDTHSILISSHILSDLEKICDYIAFLSRGKLILFEEKDAILEKYAVVKVSQSNFATLPNSAIVGKKKTAYGFDVLVKKNDVSSAFTFEKTTLEDVVLFMSAEGL